MTAARSLVFSADRSEVSLDDLMQDYLAGMTGKGADEITIRHTATHRSGLDHTKQLQKEFKGEALVAAILARDIQRPVGSQLFSAEIWRTFTSEGIVWRVGEGGDSIPACLSPQTFWHTGYTGQTLIIDPERNAYIIVLTNWTHPIVRKANSASDRARRRIAEVVIEEYLVE